MLSPRASDATLQAAGNVASWFGALSASAACASRHATGCRRATPSCSPPPRTRRLAWSCPHRRRLGDPGQPPGPAPPQGAVSARPRRRGAAPRRRCAGARPVARPWQQCTDRPPDRSGPTPCLGGSQLDPHPPPGPPGRAGVRGPRWSRAMPPAGGERADAPATRPVRLARTQGADRPAGALRGAAGGVGRGAAGAVQRRGAAQRTARTRPRRALGRQAAAQPARRARRGPDAVRPPHAAPAGGRPRHAVLRPPGPDAAARPHRRSLRMRARKPRRCRAGPPAQRGRRRVHPRLLGRAAFPADAGPGRLRQHHPPLHPAGRSGRDRRGPARPALARRPRHLPDPDGPGGRSHGAGRTPGPGGARPQRGTGGRP